MTISYIIGKIVQVNNDHIVLENNYIGYKLIPTDRINDYEIGKIVKLYITNNHCSKNNPNAPEISVSDSTKDLVKAMRSLGYEDKEISIALAKDYSKCEDLSDMVSQAIKIIAQHSSSL
ncbi:hypothetical protein FACS189459_6650 [Bacilli bacterium]|nr:hypothetical protein FACS189459_6650 [Bacilli bacterium]